MLVKSSMSNVGSLGPIVSTAQIVDSTLQAWKKDSWDPICLQGLFNLLCDGQIVFPSHVNMYIQCQNCDSNVNFQRVFDWPSISFTVRYHVAYLSLPGKAGRMMRGPTPSVQGKGMSATFDKLLELVGTGSSNVITASEIARAMEQDSLPISHDLKRLANCGTHGANTSNTERDFRRMVRGAYGFNLEPYTIKLTLDEPHLNSFIFFWET